MRPNATISSLTRTPPAVPSRSAVRRSLAVLSRPAIRRSPAFPSRSAVRRSPVVLSRPPALSTATQWLRLQAYTWLILLLFTYLPAKVAGQYDPYRFARLDISQGLSHNEVNCLLRDEKGFLWIGTMSGLNRYDGYKFKVFRHDQSDTTSLNDDFIEKILEGPDHKLWVSTRNGFNIYDPLTEKFDRSPQRFLNSIQIPGGDISGNILDIKKDSSGFYWFLTNLTGIYKYDPALKKTVRLFHQPKDTASPYAGNIAAFTVDRKGDLWIIYKDGMLEKMDGRSSGIIYRNSWLKDRLPSDLLDYRLFVDRQNDLWIYSSNSAKGVYYFNTSTRSMQHIEKGPGKTRLNTDIVNGVIQDDKNMIWIATDHGGINLLDKKDFSIHYLLNREDDDNSISQNSINTIYKDKDDIIWIGTYKKGISYHHADITKFPLFRPRLPEAKKLGYDDVNRFVEDAKGNLWIGSNGGGLLYFNRQNGRFTQYLHDPSDPGSLTNDVIVSLCIDHEQKLWIGTYYGGMDCFDGKTFRHYRHNDKDTTSLADDRIWEIMEDSQRRLWIGTFAGGLELFQRNRGRFTHFKPLAPNSVNSGYITGLTEDSKGNLWIATAYGVNVLEKSSGKFLSYIHDNAHPATTLSNNNPFSIREDARGLIWITTREGLDVFDPLSGLFKTFTTRDGLPDNTVLELETDDNNNLWVSTPNGLSNVLVTMDSTRRVSCRFRNYDASDGLQGREFNENAALRTREGELIFGGANGFNIFNPQQILHNHKIQTLTLTDLQVFNRSVGIGERPEGHVILSHAVSATKDITLHHNENVFSIEFASLDFSNPEKVRYGYRLEGFNQQWLLANEKTRLATFTNLDPGDYVFKVRTVSENGGWNPEELSLNIKILPPFWKTPLAYVLYGLLLTGLLILARRMIVQRARMRFTIEQERQEAQRLHDLDMMKIRFFTNVSHEFRTPLSLILAPMDKIILETDNPAKKSQFQLIHRNARRLLNMVNQLLDFRKLEEQELTLNLGEGDIIKFIRELSFSFVDMAEKKNIDFSFHTSIPTLFTSFDQDKLERIVFNLLSNAFKFTPDRGRISVEVHWAPNPDGQDPLLPPNPGEPGLLPNPGEKGLLRLVIKDTGIGIEKDKQEKIFLRFFQNPVPGSMVNQGSGIGLAITREFVKLHNGSIYVESEPGKGSSFMVLLPVIPVRPAPITSAATSIASTAPAITSAVPPITSATTPASVTDAALPGSSTAPPLAPTPAPFLLDGKKPVVLLVEDHEELRCYLKDNLQEFFTIIEASNGREGWQKTLGSHPDLIVSDISMPEMNGIDLCRKIKSDKRTSFVPVILLTALIEEEQQLKGLRTGA
ncbi:MAG TPA: two-component regulator propeller domain-containing protein, partial [Puia sp.]|nr:two-component regulator propeller domain-containing protein [Puia sp.]